MQIRQAEKNDFDAIWPIFSSIVKLGTTYAYARDTTKEEAYRLWMGLPEKTFVAEIDGKVVGTYYIKTNQAGPGSHVCNCGYMVAANARGKGIANALCEHSQIIAKEMGYLAMQFNLVVSTNEVAIKIWQKQGFDIVGRLPGAFDHAEYGLVDALVMFKTLN
jgi:ribosomal protein S18 acetylase RimI-like enzyme